MRILDHTGITLTCVKVIDDAILAAVELLRPHRVEVFFYPFTHDGTPAGFSIKFRHCAPDNWREMILTPQGRKGIWVTRQTFDLSEEECQFVPDAMARRIAAIAEKWVTEKPWEKI